MQRAYFPDFSAFPGDFIKKQFSCVPTQNIILNISESLLIGKAHNPPPHVYVSNFLMYLQSNFGLPNYNHQRHPFLYVDINSKFRDCKPWSMQKKEFKQPLFKNFVR